ncbi:sortase [Streptomyces sp. MJP52]|uniref:sortase domain-containing protein n=1 Tax=Streptomyces sp. MJP52 TaxID=2940555 RepID=UPI002474B751|nr:sortase [Streptomyces sp. MJP52]MDH6223307.1 sortase A [Streptomyces sp. MJP52]
MAGSRTSFTVSATLAGVAAAVLAAGCAATGEPPRAAVPPRDAVAPVSPAAVPGVPGPADPTPAPSRPDPRVREARLSIPEIGLDGLRVVRYEGTTDDWPGTRVQNRGDAASPYGPGGGVGPGETGNHLVTAHRLSAGGPLRDLPSLDAGDRVLVTSGGTVYEYRITETRTTSFRSERSLAEQRAEVPGHPGRKATRAMITVSTCATPEDDAAGNFWRDDKGNPEHRIDKVGVLVSSRPA